MKMFAKTGALFVLVLAAASADAMPLGVRTLLHAHAVAKQTLSTLFVPDDYSAVVTGDAESGYTVKPSAESGTVEVTIPDGVDAEKVTVEVAPTVESVTPHGAAIKIVKGGYDITAYLDIPNADGKGVIATSLATVKEAIVKEAIDSAKGAEIDLKASNPSIKTAPTRPGLTYTFSEGTTIEGMTQKAEKQGDGEPWKPTISVKGGASGFYSIGVGK